MPYKFTIVPSLRRFRGVYTYFGATDWKGVIKLGNRRKNYSNIHPEFCFLTPSTHKSSDTIYFVLKKKGYYFFHLIFFRLSKDKYLYAYIFNKGNKAHKTYFYFFL